MNIAAMESMEKFSKTVLQATPAQQSRFWATLSETLPEEDVKTLKLCVSSYRLFTDKAYYNAVKAAVCEQIVCEQRRQKHETVHQTDISRQHPAFHAWKR